MEYEVFKDVCCSFLCSNEYGTSTSPSWGGADAFLGISPARTISRTFCSTSHPGISICFLVSGQPSRILTISHAGYSSICVQVILICVHNSFCFTSSHGLSFHVTSRHFMSHCASGNIMSSRAPSYVRWRTYLRNFMLKQSVISSSTLCFAQFAWSPWLMHLLVGRLRARLTWVLWSGLAKPTALASH